MKYLFLIIVLNSILASTAIAEETDGDAVTEACPAENDSIACQQRRQLDAIWVDMNKTSSQLIDDIIEEPGTAEEMGCLDNLKRLDLSIVTVDPASIWTTLYASLKDSIINRGCNAIQSKINEQSARLAGRLEAPYGLGSIRLQQGRSSNGLTDLSRTRAVITNEQARQAVVTETLGVYPAPSSQSYTDHRLRNVNVDKPNARKGVVINPAKEKIESVLNFNRLWNDEENEEDENEENN